jgi:hypothetical protein
VRDLDDVDALAAHDDLIREHSTRDGDIAALWVMALVGPAVDVQSLGGSDQFVRLAFHLGEKFGGRVLGAGGLISATWEDVKKVRYPKKVRELGKLEEKAVESQLYDPLNIHGLLQTPEYARALLLMRRPAYTEDEVERFIAARVARKAVFERDPAPELSFVLEEWTLRRPLGGRPVLRRQLEHLLEIGQLRNVELQVMPMDREEHAGLAGGIERPAGHGCQAAPYP